MTTIGKYGSGTTRSKIPIGSYYGHSYILPWEWSPKLEHQTSPTTSSVACQLDLPSQSQLLTHLGSFMSLLEDIQVIYELRQEKTGLRGLRPGLTKPACTVTEASYKLEILDMSRRRIILSV